jgi:hypothetical protein
MSYGMIERGVDLNADEWVSHARLRPSLPEPQPRP